MSSAPVEYEHIWKPLTIGSTTVKHRILMTALTSNYAENHVMSERHIAFYRERARGGAALIITENQGAFRHQKGSFSLALSAWDKRAIPQLGKAADAVHEFGTKIFAQLAGWGVNDKGMMVMDEWHPLWAASRVPSIVHHEIPMVMGQEEIDEVVRGFGESALNIKVAGMDGIEIHAAHGYLLSQFLSPIYNKRDDGYGGSVRKRCQLILEVSEEIRRTVGRDFTVGIRLSIDEFMGNTGITPDQGYEQLEIFASTGLFDFFNISGGTYHSLHRSAPTMSSAPGHILPLGKPSKDIVGDRAKVFIIGPRVIDLSTADKAVAEGTADMVGMTRALFADPFLIKKAREGREREQIKCVAEGECFGRLFDGKEVTCMMNPTAGREQKWGYGTLKMISKGDAKKVIVVGGGLAGMKTAAVAAKRGHKVLLYDKEPELGGHINLLKQLPTRETWNLAIDNLVREMETGGVEVRTGVTATPELLLKENPDIVVCATGSYYDKKGFTEYRPERESIPGWDQENVIDVSNATRRALKDPSSFGNKVIIVDTTTAYLPLGLAEVLATTGGIDVEVISPHFFVGEDVYRTAEMPYLFPRLAVAGVKLTAQHFVEKIEGKDVHVNSIWGGVTRIVADVDNVVIAMMRIPNDTLYNQVKNNFKDVYRVGDVVSPRKPMAILYEAEELGRAI